MDAFRQLIAGLFDSERRVNAASRIGLLRLLVAMVMVASAAAESRASYSATVLADTPSAYWRLGETTGNIAFDSSGNGRDAIYSGPALGQSGALVGDSNSSALFNGYENDSIQRADSTGLVPGPDSWAVEAWFKVSWSGRGMEIISWYAGGYQYGHDSFYMLTLSDRGLPGYHVRDTTGYRIDLVASASVADDSWHQLVGVIDRAGSKVRLYVDGAEAASAPLGSLGLISDLGIPVNMGLQYRFWTSDYHPLEGKLDEVALYRSPLSAERVRAHYQVARGLLTDSDRDGVLDAADNCPNTPPGAAVDASGCQSAQCSPEQMELAINDAIAAKDAIIAEKDALVAQKDSTISSLNADVNSLLATLASKDELIAALNAALAARDQIITDLNARIGTMYTQAQLDQAVADAAAAAKQSGMSEISANLAVTLGMPGFVIPGSTAAEQITKLSSAIAGLPKGQMDKLKQLLAQ